MKFPLSGGVSLVNRITWAGILAVLVCAAVLGSIATVLAIQSLERQAQDTLRIVGDSAAGRIGDWIASNQRLIASTVPAALTSPSSLPAAAAAGASAAVAASDASTAASTGTAASAAGSTVVAGVAAPAAVPQPSVPLNPDAALEQALQQNLTAGGYGVTFMAFEGDHRYVRAPIEAMPPGYNPVERPWYKQAVAAGKPTIPTPYRDVKLNQLNVTFEQVVKQGDSVLGVIGALKPLTEVIKIIATVKPTEHSYAFVVDSAGTLLTHPNTDFVLKQVGQVMPWFARDTPAGEVVAVNDNGRSAWVRTVPIPGCDWQLAVVLDKADTLSGVTTLIASIGAAVLVVVVLVAILLTGLLRRSFAPLHKVRDAMVGVAGGGGDLTTRIEVVGHDEVSQIASAFNAFNETLRRIVAQVQSASGEVQLAAQEIATGNQDLSSRTEQQASTIQESSHAMQQITEVSTSNADHAHEANRIAQQTATLAEAGGSKVADVVTTMQEITESSQRIGEIIGVIDGIAFQTNILALNAAVEAARGRTGPRLRGGGRRSAQSGATQRRSGTRYPRPDPALYRRGADGRRARG